ncbi:MAG: peptide chain release factor-like protein [Candidatus Synoicihabitans palmerolidicus]|nr:peptide chain release factor-like protein [Candidatus Synoicihabitans palmerolidicus]
MDLPTQIDERLAALGTSSAEVDEQFVRGTGPGGQKINKTSSTVLLRYRPTGIEVRRQQERCQAANRRLAWVALCEKLETRRNRARALALAAREKERRRKRTRSATQKRRMVADKRHRSSIKQCRGRVSDD